MKFIQAITTDNETEFFNLEKVLTIQPRRGGEVLKILMGAGMFWNVRADSVRVVSLSEVLNEDGNSY